MIDLHTHILPGMDDGAKGISDSIAMAEIAVKDGVSTLVATPHVIKGKYDNSKEEILSYVKVLNEILKKHQIDLQVLPGAEYRIEPDLPQRLAKGELLTINNQGRHLLIELPFSLVPPCTEEVLFEIQLQGITPIFAHPERNLSFIRHPELLSSYAERGIIFQVTAASITGLFGKGIQRSAWRTIESGKGIILASDGHSSDKRSPILSEAYCKVKSVYGSKYASQIAYLNPQCVINAEDVAADKPPHKKPMWKTMLVLDALTK